jgi:hypothetical protein
MCLNNFFLHKTSNKEQIIILKNFRFLLFIGNSFIFSKYLWRHSLKEIAITYGG